MLLWNLVRLVRHIRPDVVQTWLPQMDILGGLAALVSRTPLLVSERSSAAAYPPGWKIKLRLAIGKRACGVVANSRGGMDYWRPYLPCENLHLVRNCNADELLSSDTTNESDPLGLDACPLILFAGRFSYEKNIPVLMAALISVLRRHRNATVVLCGEGPERSLADEMMASAGLRHRMRMTGYSEQLPAWMRRAAVCISVSTFEGHPNVVMEAAMHGCPLVLSDIPAHRELFDEEAAAYAPTTSPERIADAVLDALHNPAAARSRATKARKIAQRWDVPTTLEAYKRIYAGAVAG